MSHIYPHLSLNSALFQLAVAKWTELGNKNGDPELKPDFRGSTAAVGRSAKMYVAYKRATSEEQEQDRARIGALFRARLQDRWPSLASPLSLSIS